MKKTQAKALAVQYHAFMQAMHSRDWEFLAVWAPALRDTQKVAGVEMVEETRLVYWESQAREELRLEEDRQRTVEQLNNSIDVYEDELEEIDLDDTITFWAGDQCIEVPNNGD